MLLLDRRSAPYLAVGAALVVLAGGLVAVGVWWATNCFGGWVGRPLAADLPAAASHPDRADVAAAGDLRAVGVDAAVRWGPVAEPSTGSATTPGRSTGIPSSARRRSRTGSW